MTERSISAVIERKQASALRVGDLAIFPTRSDEPRRIAEIERHPKTVAVAVFTMGDDELQRRRARGQEPTTREWIRLGHKSPVRVVQRSISGGMET